MKTIELTQEHKSKLLEMSIKLFPEYIEIDIDISENYDGIQDYIQLRKKYENTIFIHWFEFCFTYLIEKLSKNLDEDYSLDDLLGYNLHPIDYLYEEFLKLK